MSKKGTKATQGPKEPVQYDVRDVVLAKVRGYPPWPGMVVDPDSAPPTVQKERPSSKGKKGMWYCVRFFPAGDYAWLVSKDISKLQQHEIQAYINEPFKRNGDLLEGYRIAQDPTKWEAEREAARAAAAEEEANEEVDQLESDEEEEVEEEEDEEKKIKTKKRKRDSDVGAKKAKAKPKKEAAEAKKKAAAKGKKNGVKSKALIESEDEGAGEKEEEDAGPSQKVTPPPAKKARKEEEDPLEKDPEAKKVRDWRHKLQKAFLSKTIPKDEDMPALSELFTTVEKYENMSVNYLQFSKIGKVMRHIHFLGVEKVPRDDEFHFKDRAKVLVERWHDILNVNKTATPAATTTNGKETSAAPVTAPAAAVPAIAAVSTPSAEVKPATTNGAATAEEKEHKEDVAMTETKPEEPAQAPAPAPAAQTEAVAEEPKPEPLAAEPSAASLMDVDADAKGEADAPADIDASVDAEGNADESVLADVTMSEAGA